ncbi:MAG: helix-turn-helix transcriptional regulator [Thalassovita sp.]
MQTTQKLAQRLLSLRQDRGWSLDVAAEQSRVSRATLSRIEQGKTSPTAETLGQLCTAYQLSMSRLLAMVEDPFIAKIPQEARPFWQDPQTGFERVSLSPPATGLRGEILQGLLPAHQSIHYDRPSRPGLEHHLVLQSGQLRLVVEGQPHDLLPGDCLRYVLHGATDFITQDSPASYLLFVI